MTALSWLRRPRRNVPEHSNIARNTYELTPQESAELNGLRDIPGVAPPFFPFWRKVAARRDVDPATIIGVMGNRNKFTALPFGHGKHWCWPSPLECQKPKDIEDLLRTRRGAA